MALGQPAGFSLEGSMSVQRHCFSHTLLVSPPKAVPLHLTHAQRHRWSVQRKQSCTHRNTGQSRESSSLASQDRHCWSVSRKQPPCISHTAGQSWESNSLASHSPKYWWSVPLHLARTHTHSLLVSPLASHTHTAGQSWQKAAPLASHIHTHCWSVSTKSSPPCISHTDSVGQSQQKAVHLHLAHTLLVSLKQAVPLQSGWSAGRASDPGRWSGMASPCWSPSGSGGSASTVQKGKG